MLIPNQSTRTLGYPDAPPQLTLERGKVYAFQQVSRYAASMPQTYELLLCLSDLKEMPTKSDVLGIKTIWYHDFWSFTTRTTTWLPYNERYAFFEVESDGTVNLEKLAASL